MTPTANLLLSLPLPGAKAVETISTRDPTPSAIVLLTRGLAAGDEAAFRGFHQRYFDRLYQFLLVVARGNEHEAQEALQQTLLRVVRYARVFDSQEAFWDWLKVLARSAARDAGRKQQRYLALLKDFALLGQNHHTQIVPDEDDAMRTALEESLNELNPNDRRLVEGKYLLGSTIRELSAATGATEKAVESRLVRLRRQLRQRLLRKLNSHETF